MAAVAVAVVGGVAMVTVETAAAVVVVVEIHLLSKTNLTMTKMMPMVGRCNNAAVQVEWLQANPSVPGAKNPYYVLHIHTSVARDLIIRRRLNGGEVVFDRKSYLSL